MFRQARVGFVVCTKPLGGQGARGCPNTGTEAAFIVCGALSVRNRERTGNVVGRAHVRFQVCGMSHFGELSEDGAQRPKSMRIGLRLHGFARKMGPSAWRAPGRISVARPCHLSTSELRKLRMCDDRPQRESHSDVGFSGKLETARSLNDSSRVACLSLNTWAEVDPNWAESSRSRMMSDQICCNIDCPNVPRIDRARARDGSNLDIGLPGSTKADQFWAEFGRCGRVRQTSGSIGPLSVRSGPESAAFKSMAPHGPARGGS